MAQLALAGLSVRPLVEAAVRAGDTACALDVFGDADTLAAASQWQFIGKDSALQIDAERVLAALHGQARNGRTAAWLYGSGFDGLADVVEAGEALLPLLGTRGRDLRRVRDPVQFFRFLADRAIAHPEVSFDACPAGWLSKSAAGCGGTHIRRAGADEALEPGRYAQREVPGRPMSATFVANGRQALLLGANVQLVQPLAPHPFVFGGVIGPVPLAQPLQRELAHALQALTAEFGLRGLCSLDFMLDGRQIQVLEVNPRPSASLPLHDHGDLALLCLHGRACAGAELPAAAPAAPAVYGNRIVYARQPMHIGARHAAALANTADVHDRPSAGTLIGPGQPLCTVAARAHDAQAVQTRLEHHAATVLHTLESLA